MNPKHLLLIQVYMPTNKYEDETAEHIYEKIRQITEEDVKDCRKTLMGHWNDIVGEGKEDQVIGEYGMGKHTERGVGLISFIGKISVYIKYLV